MGRKTFKAVAGFDDRVMILVGLPLASMVVSLLLFNKDIESGNWAVLRFCLPMSLVYTAAFWYAMRWAYIRVKMRHPAMRDIARRLMWMALVFLVVYVVVDFTLDRFFEYILPAHKGKPSTLVEFITSMLLSALVILSYEALSFYLQLQTAVAEKAQLERQNIESQLEGLRNQVNPHFLFNSLNTLVYLIPENSDKAVRFVQQLSKVYRYVLESREARMILLAEELEFLNSYIFLLKERFGENLQVRLADMNDDLESAIVPLSLQMLFENAIKHNVISTEKPLIIELFIENGHLVVRNKLQRKNQVMDSTGVGLENIRTRYRMLTDREVEIIISQEYFTVLLPIVKVKKHEYSAH